MFELVLEGVDLQNDLPYQAFRVIHHLQLYGFMSVFNIANKRSNVIIKMWSLKYEQQNVIK